MPRDTGNQSCARSTYRQEVFTIPTLHYAQVYSIHAHSPELQTQTLHSTSGCIQQNNSDNFNFARMSNKVTLACGACRWVHMHAQPHNCTTGQHHHHSTTITAPPSQHHHHSTTIAAPPSQHHHHSTTITAPPSQHHHR